MAQGGGDGGVMAGRLKYDCGVGAAEEEAVGGTGRAGGGARGGRVGCSDDLALGWSKLCASTRDAYLLRRHYRHDMILIVVQTHSLH